MSSKILWMLKCNCGYGPSILTLDAGCAACGSWRCQDSGIASTAAVPRAPERPRVDGLSPTAVASVPTAESYDSVEPPLGRSAQPQHLRLLPAMFDNDNPQETPHQLSKVSDTKLDGKSATRQSELPIVPLSAVFERYSESPIPTKGLAADEDRGSRCDSEERGRDKFKAVGDEDHRQSNIPRGPIPGFEQAIGALDDGVMSSTKVDRSEANVTAAGFGWRDKNSQLDGSSLESKVFTPTGTEDSSPTFDKAAHDPVVDSDLDIRRGMKHLDLRSHDTEPSSPDLADPVSATNTPDLSELLVFW